MIETIFKSLFDFLTKKLSKVPSQINFEKKMKFGKLLIKICLLIDDFLYELDNCNLILEKMMSENREYSKNLKQDIETITYKVNNLLSEFIVIVDNIDYLKYFDDELHQSIGSLFASETRFNQSLRHFLIGNNPFKMFLPMEQINNSYIPHTMSYDVLSYVDLKNIESKKILLGNLQDTKSSLYSLKARLGSLLKEHFEIWELLGVMNKIK